MIPMHFMIPLNLMMPGNLMMPRSLLMLTNCMIYDNYSIPVMIAYDDHKHNIVLSESWISGCQWISDDSKSLLMPMNLMIPINLLIPTVNSTS